MKLTYYDTGYRSIGVAEATAFVKQYYTATWSSPASVNLPFDAVEGLDEVRWTVYGKINQITKNSGAVIGYGYDPGGNRTFKQYQSSDTTSSTYYVRDAQGTVLAVYEKFNTEELKWSEQHLYGSSRLGMWKADTVVPAAPPIVLEDNPVYDSLQYGSRLYELSNHLGNVLSVISDKKTGNDSSGIVNYYFAEVLSQNDYYPVGMGMVGRKYDFGKYRFGFNGKENDSEVKGEGNQQDYGMRIYDPSLGRFLSVDPISKKYPELTVYQFASNTPIQAIDLDGLEAFFVHGTISDNTRWFICSGSNAVDQTLMKGLLNLTRNKIGDASFNWTREVPNTDQWFRKGTHRLNRLMNNQSDRKIAAQDLVTHVMEYRKIHGIDEYDNKGALVKLGTEPITFIAHSHGGNVSIQAAGMLFEKYKMQSDIITISTPAYTSKNDKENPAYVSGVRKLLAIWNETDGFSGGFAGSDYYPIGPNSKVKRIEVDASSHYKGQDAWKDAHSFDNNYMQEFIRQVNENPTNKTLKNESN